MTRTFHRFVPLPEHLVSFALLLLLSRTLFGGVSDPQIMTDHPVYRGELSCSTLERTVRDAYRVFADRYGHAPANDTEKLVALWIWQCEHHMHNLDPLVFVGPGHPDADPEGWAETRDRNLGQFSFGFSLCYTIHAQFSALVGYALGDLKKTNCPNVPGHTPFEAFVDGKWALADMTTGMMVFGDDGRPMSIAEIIPHVIAGGASEAQWTSDPRRTGFGRFRMTPFGDNWEVYKAKFEDQKLFGYSGMPIAYELRPGESFTRYLDPGLEDGSTWYFWGHDYFKLDPRRHHGPFRNVTFLDDPPVGNDRKGQGLARYGNGVFDYSPPLSDGRYREGLWNGTASSGLTYRDGALRASGEPAELVFVHASPYVIAARPARPGHREWQLRTEECLGGALVSGRSLGKARVAVSTDAGRSWQHIGTADGGFHFDFTDLVKGHHFYLLRLALAEGAGLAALKMQTITQISRAVFPRLKEGGSTVTYSAGEQVPIFGGPSRYLAERFRQADLEPPGFRVYRIEAPAPIRSAAGVARCEGSGPSPWGPWSVEFSLDDGRSWKAGVKDLTLTEAESGWGGGRNAYAWAQIEEPQNSSAELLIRLGKGNILAAEVYATYQKPSTSDLHVTYGWTEGGTPKSHSHRLSAGTVRDSWEVPTGREVRRQWVRFDLP